MIMIMIMIMMIMIMMIMIMMIMIIIMMMMIKMMMIPLKLAQCKLLQPSSVAEFTLMPSLSRSRAKFSSVPFSAKYVSADEP